MTSYRNVTTEPTNAEIKIVHDVAEKQINRFGFVAAFNAHKDRGVLLDRLKEAWNNLECAVANAQGWKTATEKAEARLNAVEEKLSTAIEWSMKQAPKGCSDNRRQQYLRGDNAAGGAYELATEIQDIIK